jgi:YYY domain-containing protein
VCLFRPPGTRDLPRASLIVGLSAVSLFVTSSFLYQPYLQRYQLFYSGVEPVSAHTAVSQWVTIQGVWLFILASYLAVAWALPVLVRWERSPVPVTAATAYYSLALPITRTGPADLNGRAGAALTLVAALALSTLGYGTLAIVSTLAAALVALAWLRWRSPETLFTCGLALLGLAVVSVPEVVAIKGDVGRMNTFFKFYYQAWTLLGLVSAVWLVRLVRLCLRRAAPASIIPTTWRRVWMVTAMLLVAATLMYPLRAAPSRLASRFSPLPPTLDGMAFMRQAVYKDRDQDVRMPADYAAIRWLQENVNGSPVLLEANTGLYKWGSRVSIFTGLPTVVGWDWHEKQQRVATVSAVDQRLRDVKTMFETPRLEQALPLLRKYNVAYVYVGGLERIYYPVAGLRKFEEAPSDVLQPVYKTAGVTIYRLQDVL